MRLWLGSWAACLLVAAGPATSSKTTKTRNIAIIGAGAAGSSAAYYLGQYAEQEGVVVNVTMFEKTDRVGGRCLTVNAYDDPSQPIELGASILVKVNHVLYNATQRYNLTLGGMTRGERDDITAIWDGKAIVFQTTQGTSGRSWWEMGKLWWRYGTSPYWATRLVDDMVDKFLQLYEPPHFPFPSLNARAQELGLVNYTGVTGEQFLAEHKIDPRFSREMIQPATRVNYASNLAYIHGLETMVSFATDGAVSVEDGNWQIFDNMVQDSKATLLRSTSVRSLAYANDEGGSPRRFVLSTSHEEEGNEGKEEEYPVEFDDVIMASPWQFSQIKADEMVKVRIEEIPYTKLHVTLFASPFRLRAGFFGLAAGSQAPSSVYTTLAEGEEAKPGAEGVGRAGFYSISTLRRATNPETQKREFVYKIFSAAAVTPEFLGEILDGEGDLVSWYYPHWFHSYPVELPRVTFQDPVIGSGLYYTSGIESFISTMETSALMGMNVARLIVDEMAGVDRRPESTEAEEAGGEL